MFRNRVVTQRESLRLSLINKHTFIRSEHTFTTHKRRLITLKHRFIMCKRLVVMESGWSRIKTFITPKSPFSGVRWSRKWWEKGTEWVRRETRRKDASGGGEEARTGISFTGPAMSSHTLRRLWANWSTDWHFHTQVLAFPSSNINYRVTKSQCSQGRCIKKKVVAWRFE